MKKTRNIILINSSKNDLVWKIFNELSEQPPLNGFRVTHAFHEGAAMTLEELPDELNRNIMHGEPEFFTLVHSGGSLKEITKEKVGCNVLNLEQFITGAVIAADQSPNTPDQAQEVHTTTMNLLTGGLEKLFA